MRRSAGPLVYVFAIASLCTLQAHAQNSAELPDAPSPIAVSKTAQPYLPTYDPPTDSETDLAASIKSRIEKGDFALTPEEQTKRPHISLLIPVSRRAHTST